MLGGYQDGSAWSNNSTGKVFCVCVLTLSVNKGPIATPLPGRLLRKSLSLIGFFLPHYASFQPAHLARMRSAPPLCVVCVVKSYRSF
jgi:hypothetical protein